MDFFNTVFLYAKTATAFAVTKTRDGLAHLVGRPTTIKCVHCDTVIVIPANAYNWVCECNTSNPPTLQNCSGCQKPRAVQAVQNPMIACPQCQTMNTIPSSNATKFAGEVVTETKKLAVATVAKAQAEIQYLRSDVQTFNCEHCQTLLENPNTVPHDGPGAPAAPAQPITTIGCPVCKQVTSIPSSNLVNKIRQQKGALTSTVSKLGYTVAGKRYADCPVCSNPCVFAEPAPSPAPGGVAAPMPAASVCPVTCPRCQAQFSATIAH